MSKLDFKGTEFDSFFVKKDDLNQEKIKLNKNIKTELQNSVITEKQKTAKLITTTLAKRDNPDYMRVTTAIKKSTLKKIKDYMWENNIKNFDDALELFLLDKPVK